MKPTKKTWEERFKSYMTQAARKAGMDITALRWERCTTDQTWGDRVGLVFFGAAPEVNERAAKFFEAWARKYLRALSVVGGYESQESIAFEGTFEFSRYSNGAQGWHRVRPLKDWEMAHAAAHPPVESFKGAATSFVYYPCAD